MNYRTPGMVVDQRCTDIVEHVPVQDAEVGDCDDIPVRVVIEDHSPSSVREILILESGG